MPRKSTGEYPHNWNEIATQVKEDAGWKCERCNHDHDVPAGYTLTVHHLDLDKSNCNWWNIPALCQRCHLTIQAKVFMERPWLYEHTEWFRPFVAGYYAYQAGYYEHADKMWVYHHADYLLHMPPTLVAT